MARLRPDDGTLAMVALAAVAWIAWAVVAVSVVLEVIAQIRGLPAPSLPGLGAPQRSLGRLVAVAALLFVATPTVVAAFPAAPAHAATAAPVRPAPPVAASPASPVLPDPAPVPAPAAEPRRETSTLEYKVKRGDSLWKIADRLLGDGARFPEIVRLNSAVLNGKPDFITPGTVLLVPNEAPEPNLDHSAGVYVVKPGDTLSQIADAHLGDPLRFPELFEASRATVQPDGTQLTDPDLIRPGWEITIPGQVPDEHPDEPADEPAIRSQPAPDAEAALPAPTTEPTHTQAQPVEPEPEPVITSSTTEDNDEAESSTPGWLLPGLSGAGALLAAALLLTVRANRSTQLRYRRPGQTLEPPPQDLRAVEKTAFFSGAPMTATLAQLDRALDHLAADCTAADQALPPLITATLAKNTVTLHLAEDVDLPGSWTGSGREWSLDLDAPLAERDDVLSPYPMLVSIGQDASGLHLVNLEHLGIVTLAGDPDRAQALARHIAAELALNPWSTLVDIQMIGFGHELADLDRWRLTHHRDSSPNIPSIARHLKKSLEMGWDDPEPFHVILTTGSGTDELAPLLVAPTSRIGAALVSLAAPVPESTEIHVDHTGRLNAPALSLDLHSAGLSSFEATTCSAIVGVTRESQPIAIPPFERSAGGWRALADQAGSLRQELTEARTAEPPGAESLLPGPTEDYIAAAATTPEDIGTLAPVVREEIRESVEEADPTLDQDLADWFDTDSERPKRPKLTLLGPVNARAYGDLRPAITKRKPYFVEILAYLALHPSGATASQVADAFGLAASRARTDVSALRNWLGINPDTKEPYLPGADKSPAFLKEGVRAYQVQNVLVDLDLFRRLRLRGQARGADGIADLTTAMSLVTGPPFSNLREKGWSWLLDTERHHETIERAIVDTAHTLVIDAMAKGDLHLARQVAETACEAAPYDEICRLDLIEVTATEGHEEAAAKMLRDDVTDRTDDYQPPIELSDRTGEILATRKWRQGGHSRRKQRA